MCVCVAERERGLVRQLHSCGVQFGEVQFGSYMAERFSSARLSSVATQLQAASRARSAIVKHLPLHLPLAERSASSVSLSAVTSAVSYIAVRCQQSALLAAYHYLPLHLPLATQLYLPLHLPLATQLCQRRVSVVQFTGGWNGMHRQMFQFNKYFSCIT